MSFSKTIRNLVVFTPSAHGYHYGPLCEHLRLLCLELNIQLHTVCTINQELTCQLMPLEQADGIIIIHNAVSSSALDKILAYQIPVISVGYQYPQQIDAVMHNNNDGIIQAVTHLYERGHREIAFVSAPGDQNTIERVQAFKECQLAYNLPGQQQACIQVNSHSFPGGHAAAEQLIHMEPMPSAVICSNDLLAVGLCERLSHHGWYAPEHIAIVGFEGLEVGQQHKPQLSTVSVDSFAMAESAIERLLTRARYPELPQLTLRVECQLQPSQSCGGQRQPNLKALSSPGNQFTNAYLSTHEHLSSDLAELISLHSGLGHFMQWACIARWQQDAQARATLKLVEVHGEFAPQSIGLSEDDCLCPIEEFPRAQWLAPYVKGAVQLLTIPLMVHNEPWGVLCLAGTVTQGHQLNDYQQFASIASALAERIERNELENLVMQQGKQSETLQKQLHQEKLTGAEGLWEWDLLTDQVHWDSRACDLLALSEEGSGALTEGFLERVYIQDRQAVQKRLESHLKYGTPFSVSCRMTRNDGTVRWLATSGEVVNSASGQPRRLIGNIQDTTEKRRSKHEFAMKSPSDPVTGLPDRSLVKEQLERQIEQAPNQALAVLQIGLDRFQHLNSRYGHEQGDKLLQLVGRTLKSSLRDSDFFARFNGDEFICLCPIDNQRQAMGMASRLKGQLELPLEQELGIDFYTTASIGVTLYPEHAGNSADLLRRADIAMHKAKENGKNQVALYKCGIQADPKTRAHMDNELRKAIPNGELELAYQPQHHPETNKILGVEALLRWHSKELGQISPAEFIPLAEENGQIVELGYWVLKESCKTLKQWQLAYGADLTMSVNVSAGQLSQAGFFKTAIEIIRSTGINPNSLILEITESTVIADVENVRHILNQFISQGIQIALDDFGTGFSSISLLRQLPLNCLKVDRSFFNKLSKDSQDWHILKAIQELSSALGFRLVAEGVETLAQLTLARELKCDLVQGYVYSQPLPQTTLEARYFLPENGVSQQLA